MSFSLDNKNKQIYNLINTISIEENNLVVYELMHIKTKSKILIYETDDENKVFNICFKTPVENEKGIPHILEHSVLCGSKKYNVRDPFIELAKSSLNTFLNAMTFPDKTCYPVASANFKDFCNLMDVYLDAVFYPRIYNDKKIFMQEGWHYEIEDKNSELTLNGVVLNEMKGVFSNPDGLLESAILRSLYDGTNYSFESGGDPDFIPDLTYAEFLNFHKKYYSPTNSIISLYGDMDFNERLSYIDNEYLSKFDYDKNNEVNFDDYTYDKKLKKVDGLYEYKTNYNVTEILDNTSVIAYNFSLDENKNNLKHIVMNILDYILFNQEGAIIKEKLLNKGLGLAVDSMYEPGFVKGFYSIISHNIDENKKYEFIKTIDDELKNIVENGIDREKLEAGINIVKFNYLENETLYPKGLQFVLNTLDSYLYGKNIDEYIKYKNSFDIIEKEDLNEKNNIFIKTIKEVFLNNTDKSLALVTPMVDLLKNKQVSENNKLSVLKNKMSDLELSDVINETKELKIYQSVDNEDKSCLPKLNVRDIDRDKKLIDYQLDTISDKKILWTNKKINELVFYNFDIFVPIDNMSVYEKYLCSLLLKIITKIDTKNYNYKQLNNLIDKNTGLFQILAKINEEKFLIRFNVKTTKNKLNLSFVLIEEVLFNSIFDDYDRILTIINELKTESNISVNSMGHISSFARALSSISRSYDYNDKFSISGIGFNYFINFVSDNFDKLKKVIINDIYKLYNKYFDMQNIMFDICSEASVYDEFKIEISKRLEHYKNISKQNNVANDFSINNYVDFKNKIESFIRTDNSEAFLTANDVNFVSRAGRFDKNKYTGVLQLVRTILNYEYLWTNIRVLGGAYGTSSKFDRSGFGGFTTFRDPNLINSDKTFLNIEDYIKNINIDYDTIEKYIIGTMGNIDNPVNNNVFHERNFDAYINDVTNDMINKNRHEILDAKIDDIKNISNLIHEILNTDEVCSLVAVKSEDEAKKYYKKIRKLNFDE